MSRLHQSFIFLFGYRSFVGSAGILSTHVQSIRGDAMEPTAWNVFHISQGGTVAPVETKGIARHYAMPVSGPGEEMCSPLCCQTSDETTTF